VNAGAVVTVLTDNASVTVDYRTGRIELRPGTCRTAPHPTLRHVRGGPSWGTSETLAVLPDAGSAPARWRAAALPVLIVVVGVRVIGPRRGRFARLVELGCYGRSRRPATREQAVHAVRAVRWAARLVPARWGCLEQSVAAALLLACAGRRAEWRHGMATDPIRLHAWIADSAGRPVEEPDETCLYTPICTPDGPGAPPGPREEHTP
jgi:hypothetical protein